MAWLARAKATSAAAQLPAGEEDEEEGQADE
jgi:hypothetical protein